MGKKSKVVTVKDILTQDDVNTVISQVNKHSDKIEKVLCICVDREGILRVMGNVCNHEIVYMCEALKQDVIMQDLEEMRS